MARAIYELQLKERFFPALSVTEALEMCANNSTVDVDQGEWEVSEVCKEEHTMKLFLLAKTMEDTNKFEFNEIESAVRALARELGYYKNYEEITDCILTWVERFDEMTIIELQEWIIG